MKKQFSIQFKGDTSKRACKRKLRRLKRRGQLTVYLMKRAYGKLETINLNPEADWLSMPNASTQIHEYDLSKCIEDAKE